MVKILLKTFLCEKNISASCISPTERAMSFFHCLLIDFIKKLFNLLLKLLISSSKLLTQSSYYLFIAIITIIIVKTISYHQPVAQDKKHL